MNLLWNLADAAIAFAYIATPWVLLANGADKLDIEIPDWLDDGLIGTFLFVGWAVFAMYLARQTTLGMGFGP
ncbi:hypothetical protein N9L80_05210 [Luminiphilus sp.]|jgi:hypothetical protein|nr:hypothetical protein [Luminiphilus sp.]